MPKIATMVLIVKKGMGKKTGCKTPPGKSEME